ncbi:MAG: ACP S-malonyltransferase [Candidatus Daviesbacteria bacterium]|nr:ACP S-malonyltransferase [Candidatus Daviesbacteria bacterium]
MTKEALLFPGQGIGAKQIIEYSENLGAVVPKILHDYLSLAQAVTNEIYGSKTYKIDSIVSGESPQLLANTGLYQLVACALNLAGFAYNREHLTPEYIAGHSLGEYIGVIAAGGLTEEEGMDLVGWRGLFMLEAAQKRKSGLVSISGLSETRIQALFRDLNGYPPPTIALKNAPPAFVLGCDEEYMPTLIEEAQKAGAINVNILDVAAAFHTPLMEEAAKNLAGKLGEYSFRSLKVAVVANLTGEPVAKGEIYPADYLIKSMTQTVEWVKTMEFLKTDGVDSYWVEGPGNTLKQLCIFNGIARSQIRGNLRSV